jgi:hypothetical protein
MTHVGPQVERRGRKCRCNDGLPSCDLTGTVCVCVCGYGRQQNPIQIWAVAALSFHNSIASLIAFLDTIPSSFLPLLRLLWNPSLLGLCFMSVG